MLAAATGLRGYDARPALTDARLATLLANLDRIAAHAADAACSPPCTRTSAPWSRGRRRSTGCSPGRSSRSASTPGTCSSAAPTRWNWRVRPRTGSRTSTSRTSTPAWPAGCGPATLTYTEAVRQGVYRPLGDGDVDIPAIVAVLTAAGYDGWYVLEQDTILAAEPPPGAGPVEDVCASVAFLEAA